MADVVHTRRARADLKRIWRYIALDSETAADRFLLRLASRIDDLSLFPDAGPPQDHKSKRDRIDTEPSSHINGNILGMSYLHGSIGGDE